MVRGEPATSAWDRTTEIGSPATAPSEPCTDGTVQPGGAATTERTGSPPSKIPVLRGRQNSAYGGTRFEVWYGERCIGRTYGHIPSHWIEGRYAGISFDHIRVPEDFNDELPDWCEWAGCKNCKFSGFKCPKGPLCNGGCSASKWLPREK